MFAPPLLLIVVVNIEVVFIRFWTMDYQVKLKLVRSQPDRILLAGWVRVVV